MVWIRATVASTLCDTWELDTTNINVTSRSYMLDRFNDHSRIMCAGACEKESQCESFFFQTSTRKCQLHSLIFPKHGAFVDATEAESTEYYHRPLPVVVCPGTTISGLTGKYFIPNDVEKSWKEAFKTCQSLGAEMTSIPDQAAINALKPLMASSFGLQINASALWVNARVSYDRNSFIWCDSKEDIPLNSSLWYTNQPELYKQPGNMNAANKTECVILIPFYNYKLDDYSCENGRSAAMLYPLCKCVP